MSGENIRRVRKEKGFTLEDLADKAGMSAGQLSRLESSKRNLKADQIAAIAGALEVEPAELMGPPPMVPIVGLAGAGPEGSVLFATGDGNFGEVPAPRGATPTTRALEVRGDSMHGLANDGWMVWYDEEVTPTQDHMGEPCVCFLEDERVLIKLPFPGSEPGLFNLESLNAPTMRDVPVRYMALITDIKPKRSAQKWIKRNPDEPINDVTTAGRVLKPAKSGKSKKRSKEPA